MVERHVLEAEPIAEEKTAVWRLGGEARIRREGDVAAIRAYREVT